MNRFLAALLFLVLLGCVVLAAPLALLIADLGESDGVFER